MLGKWVIVIEHLESNYGPLRLNSVVSGGCPDLGSTWPGVPLPFW